MRIDIHQHIWTEPLLDALEGRERLPFVRRSDGLTTLHCANERAYLIDPAAQDAEQRVRENARDGIDLAIIAPSSPIGLEIAPRAEAQGLIEAHLEGARALGPGFAAWGPIPLEAPDPDDVDRVLGAGCLGVSLPAGALSDPDEIDTLVPVLERLQHHDAPLFVHPGPGPSRPARREASLSEPVWWRALTDYVAQMQAAWLAFVTLIRREVPELVTVFAMLAGGAPLLSERLESRGGPPVAPHDPLTFYEPSSYGLVAIAAMAERVGMPQLLFGSDRPLAEPPTGGRREVMLANTGRLFESRCRRVLA